MKLEEALKLHKKGTHTILWKIDPTQEVAEIVEDKHTLSSKIVFKDGDVVTYAGNPVYSEDDVKEALKDILVDFEESKLSDGMVHIDYIKEVFKDKLGDRLI